jgi:hypothetical protein
MDSIQFNLALAIYYEFLDDDVSGFECWRDCAGVVHFTGVHDEKVLEASVYMDDDTYFVFYEHVEWQEEQESDEEEEEEEEEEESSDEEYEPRKRQRRQ